MLHIMLPFFLVILAACAPFERARMERNLSTQREKRTKKKNKGKTRNEMKEGKGEKNNKGNMEYQMGCERTCMYTHVTHICLFTTCAYTCTKPCVPVSLHRIRDAARNMYMKRIDTMTLHTKHPCSSSTSLRVSLPLAHS